jgi:hypothetical protein
VPNAVHFWPSTETNAEKVLADLATGQLRTGEDGRHSRVYVLAGREDAARSVCS